MSYKVSAKRHLVKTITYRVFSTGIGFAIMWLVTGSIKLGAAFGILELVYKSIQYYIHEIIWYKWIKFGLIDITEKKKKTTPVVEGKIKNQIKEGIESPPPPTGKKVLSYSSNR